MECGGVGLKNGIWRGRIEEWSVEEWD